MSDTSNESLLAEVVPFDCLGPAELAIVSKVLTEISFEPGAVIQLVGKPVNRVLIRTQGSWLSDQTELPDVVGIGAVMGTSKDAREIVAGPSGVTCLAIQKGHFFTIIYECPQALVRLLAAGDHAGEIRRFR